VGSRPAEGGEVNNAAALLADTARRGELHHAVILHGPSMDALREAAIGVAKALNCLNRTTGDDCLACQHIDRRIHPDVHMIEVGSERKLISVEQIRDLVAEATLRPYEGRTKVFIIDPADALSPGGSNALLKTLEEPVRDTTFILLTRSPDLLLPTIRSRSQAIYVGGNVQRDEEFAADIAALLEQFAKRKESAALLALAAIVAGQDDVSQSMALLAEILCEAAAGRPSLEIPRERLLAAADASVFNTRWLTVNADARMLVEQALAALVLE
jgi:DNA polymerase III delta prime subunit